MAENTIQRYTDGWRTLKVCNLNCEAVDEGSFLISFVQNNQVVFEVSGENIRVVTYDTIQFFVSQEQSAMLSTIFKAQMFLDWAEGGERKAGKEPLVLTVLANYPEREINDADEP